MSHQAIRRPGAREAGTLGGLLLAVVLWACAGENLFQPRGVLVEAPPTVEIQEPRADGARPVGDSILVSARIQHRAELDRVVFGGVALRGDPDLGTDEVVQRFQERTVSLEGLAVADTVLSRFLIPTEVEERETVQIFTEVHDVDGNVGADTVQILLGGPRVTVVNVEDGQRVRSGLTMTVRVEASDPDGVSRVEVHVDGVFEDVIEVDFDPALTSVVLDTALAVPDGLEGNAELRASARNTEGLEGQDGPFRLRVGPTGVADEDPPELRVEVDAGPRLEVNDEITLRITGSDGTQGSGVERVGYTVLAISPSRGDTLVQSQERVFDAPRTGTVTADFAFEPFNFDLLSLPDTLQFEVTGYMVDAAGNCGASTSSEDFEAVSCATLPGGEIVAEGRGGVRLIRPVVSGRTVQLPNPGVQVMDAVVDTRRRNLYLSNLGRNQVEIFRLLEERFLSPVRVGSEPWGLDFLRSGDPSGDRLIVANSGGTNVSFVSLGQEAGTGPFQEMREERFFTPPVTLFDVEASRDDLGFVRYSVQIHPSGSAPSFSDRPQFLARDFTGRILYSTKTTILGDRGTIRKAFTPPDGDRTEVQLFFQHASLADAPDVTALANIDDVTTQRQESGDVVVLQDRVPGTSEEITGGPAAVEGAAQDLAAQGSDVFWGTGQWDVEALSFHDTTFVSASGDRRWVVFGEGATDPIGRIIMYNAAADAVSGVIPVTDLMTDASETVRGVGLNHDGTLGVARGFDAYFFTTDLRLQGISDVGPLGTGATLHPLHANYPSLDNPGGAYEPNTHLAFLGTGDGAIDIVDAFHFRRTGKLTLRDDVAGPIRAVLPFPEDNEGRQCATRPIQNRAGETIGQAVEIFADPDGLNPHPAMGGPTEDACVVLKVFAVTDVGGVVVIDVRKADILKEHPARQ